MNLCVNVYLNFVSAWIIVNNIIRFIARSSVIYNSKCWQYVGSGGTRFFIDMHFCIGDIIYTTSIWCLYFYVQ